MKIRFLIISLILSSAFLIGTFCAHSQAVYIQISPTDEVPAKIKLPSPFSAADSASAMAKLIELKTDILNRGYLTTGFDEIRFTDDTVHAYLTFGPYYEWAFLERGNVPEEYITDTRHREKLFASQPFVPSELSQFIENILVNAENRGYPFATLKLDSIEINNNGVKGKLLLEPNQLVVIDSLIVKGSVRTNPRYLQNHLGIKKGMVYNQAMLNKIPMRLRELPFVSVIKPFEIGMRAGRADIYIYLDDRKASNFNGIIGVMPDAQSGKTLITGDVELNLIDNFKQGESVNVKWQRLQTRTQELNLAAAYPYIFHTPFGFEFGLDLYRRDTLFSNLKSLIGAQYFFKGGKYARLFYENNQSNVISSESFSLDEYIDSRTNLFGIGLNFHDVDYRFNPSKGYFIETSASAGKKKILKNPKVDETAYENIALESDIYNLVLNTGIYFPLAKRSVILSRVRGAYILNDNMFKNEIFRIGGMKTIRGFNEQSIFASGFAVGTLEYRFLLEENSNIFLFYDYGYAEDRSGKNYIDEHLMGVGAGINFETNAGIFSLTYALGKQGDRNFQVRDGKIHFGFISFF